MFIYGEKLVAQRVGLCRKALYALRTEQMEQGVHWASVKHESRQKIALSADGVILLVSALKSGSLTEGEPVRVTASEIMESSILSGMPTGNGPETEDGRRRTEKSEKNRARRVLLLPAPPGVGGSPLEAVLVVEKRPDHYANLHTIVCRVKDGELPERHIPYVTDSSGFAYCRVKSKEKFIVGMEVPARFDGGNVWDITRPCPRRRGKW
jgi:hypothetical protein